MYIGSVCGRYVRRSDKQRIAEAFHLGKLPDAFILPPDYNVAPTTFQPVIRLNRDTGEREIVMMRWGLVPYFAKSAADFKGFSTINAKAETVQEKPSGEVRFRSGAASYLLTGSMNGRRLIQRRKSRSSTR